jgi:hypothetical protein
VPRGLRRLNAGRGFLIYAHRFHLFRVLMLFRVEFWDVSKFCTASSDIIVVYDFFTLPFVQAISALLGEFIDKFLSTGWLTIVIIMEEVYAGGG